MEKIVIISFWSGDPTISGEFSLVSHIGALVPRFIYSPIEDVSFNLFSKMAADKNEKSKISNEEELKLIGRGAFFKQFIHPSLKPESFF